jgi:hypothetical protein
LAGKPVVRGFVLLDREELAVSEGEPVAVEALPLRSLDGNELGAARFELVKVAELTPGRFASPQPAAFGAQTRTRRKGAVMECPPQDFTRGILARPSLQLRNFRSSERVSSGISSGK